LLKSNNTPSRVKFTIGRVNDFVCSSDRKEELLWDSAEKTLCIRARASGKKAYYFQSRLNSKVIKIRISSLSDVGVTFEKARQKASEYQALIGKGKDPRLEMLRNFEKDEIERNERAKKGVKVKQVISDYIGANRSEWGDSHLNDYLKSIEMTERGRNGILYDLKSLKIDEFTASRLLNWLKLEKRHRPTAAAKGYRLVRAAFYWANGQAKYKGAFDTDQLFNNSEIKKALPKPKAKTDSLQKQMLPLWFEAVKGIDNRIMSGCLQTLLLTGARREEILSLEWDDVDFKWGSLKIADKVEGNRVIPLTPYVAQLLVNLPKRNKWVFSSPSSSTGRLIEPYKAHADALARVELPRLSIHGLRRSFGTLSEWVECPVGIVAQIQGHKPSATAEKHYRVRPLDLLAKWHNKIEKEILEFAGIEQPEELCEGLRVVK
jgi:integrase